MMFFLIAWLGLTMLSGAMSGGGGVAATDLTAGITAADTSIPVTSTDGFSGNGGVITIGTEEILYYGKDGTHFKGTIIPPHTLERGYNGTTAVAHTTGEMVYTEEMNLVNNALQMSIVKISDSSGIWKAIDMGSGFFSALGTFLTAPFGLLGSGMAWVTYIWGAMGLGFILTLFVALAGARRVA